MYKNQLRQMYRQAKALTSNSSEFHSIFCRLYNFDQIPFSEDIKVDFVLHTDTDLIYTPN